LLLTMGLIISSTIDTTNTMACNDRDLLGVMCAFSLLLCCCCDGKLSLSVTCAKSPRQVINILNYEGGEIDIILAEVDLPVSKCFKMLKYIARNKDLRHIPIISRLHSYTLPASCLLL
jgi:CheY-like chemotaxis protein